jgi:hypothetical protein
MRDAFKEGVDRNLCSLAIRMARGEDVDELVKAIANAANAGDDKTVSALGKMLNTARTTQLAAIEFCKRVGFGADPKPIDDSAAAELVAAMLAEARARVAEKAKAIETAPAVEPAK